VLINFSINKKKLKMVQRNAENLIFNDIEEYSILDIGNTRHAHQLNRSYPELLTEHIFFLIM